MAGFGFSVGDFVATGQLAWNVYKSCKEYRQLVISSFRIDTDALDNPQAKELAELSRNCLMKVYAAIRAIRS